MKHPTVTAAAWSLKDVLWPAEIGEQVVSHVLVDAQEPQPDFAAMQRTIQAERTEKPATVHDVADHG
jgi:hypothetical protein